MSSGDQASAPIWSPEGTRLVVNQLNQLQDSDKLVLVDLEAGRAYQIDDHADAMGWMK